MQEKEDNTHVSDLTIDVEDGVNIAMRDYFRVDMDPTERVVSNVDLILEICAKNNVKGTFFILGEVAEKYPDIVKTINNEGHELGIHGYHHDQIAQRHSNGFEHGRPKAERYDAGQSNDHGYPH